MISIDLTGLESITNLARDLPEAIEGGLDRGGEVLMQAQHRQMQITYSRIIPTSRTGRAKWERSGDLLNGQEINSEPGRRTIVITGPAAEPITGYPGGYAERLADLPTGPDGVNRTNKFSENAARITEPQVVVAVEQEIRNRLGL